MHFDARRFFGVKSGGGGGFGFRGAGSFQGTSHGYARSFAQRALFSAGATCEAGSTAPAFDASEVAASDAVSDARSEAGSTAGGRGSRSGLVLPSGPGESMAHGDSAFIPAAGGFDGGFGVSGGGGCGSCAFLSFPAACFEDAPGDAAFGGGATLRSSNGGGGGDLSGGDGASASAAFAMSSYSSSSSLLSSSYHASSFAPPLSTALAATDAFSAHGGWRNHFQLQHHLGAPRASATGAGLGAQQQQQHGDGDGAGSFGASLAMLDGEGPTQRAQHSLKAKHLFPCLKTAFTSFFACPRVLLLPRPPDEGAARVGFVGDHRAA